jgi:TonB family protein
VVVFLGLVALVWHLLTDMGATKREVAATPMLMLPPPPPPPPVPEKLPDPVPEKVEKIPEPQPTPDKPLEKPMDDKAPSPDKDLGDPVTINGDAQAGTDNFGVGAGSGGGSTGGGGGGLGSAAYSGYMTNMLQQGLVRDPRTRLLAFDDIRVNLWLDAAGKLTKVELVEGSGDPKIDQAVLAMVRSLGGFDQRPPASLPFPSRMTIKGRRPG